MRSSFLAIAVAGASCALLGAWLALALRRLRVGLRARGYNVRGRRAERVAERLLLARGYRICERQACTRYQIAVDRGTHDVELVFDFIVERDGERLVAEVKTGAAARGVTCAETRRQLLEYQLAFGATRVVLVDPERETVREVAFPIGVATAASAAPARALWPLCALALLALLAAAWQHVH